jgi:hypothetical protein
MNLKAAWRAHHLKPQTAAVAVLQGLGAEILIQDHPLMLIVNKACIIVFLVHPRVFAKVFATPFLKSYQAQETWMPYTM